MAARKKQARKAVKAKRKKAARAPVRKSMSVADDLHPNVQFLAEHDCIRPAEVDPEMLTALELLSSAELKAIASVRVKLGDLAQFIDGVCYL